MFDGANQAEPPDGLESGPTDDPADDDVSLDPDGDLPWPNVARVADWWHHNRGRLPSGQRHLLGTPHHPQWLQRVLEHGCQPHRAAAALELRLLDANRPIWEVRAPAFRQMRGAVT